MAHTPLSRIEGNAKCNPGVAVWAFLALALGVPVTNAAAQPHGELIDARLGAFQRELSARENYVLAAHRNARLAIEALGRFGAAIDAAQKIHAGSLRSLAAAPLRQSLAQLETNGQLLVAASREAFNAQERARESLDDLDEHAGHLHLKASELAVEVASQAAAPRLLFLSNILRTESQDHVRQAKTAISGLREIVNTALVGIAALGPIGERVSEEASRRRKLELRGANVRDSDPAALDFAAGLRAAGARLARIRESVEALPVRLAADYPSDQKLHAAKNEIVNVIN